MYSHIDRICNLISFFTCFDVFEELKHVIISARFVFYWNKCIFDCIFTQGCACLILTLNGSGSFEWSNVMLMNQIIKYTFQDILSFWIIFRPDVCSYHYNNIKCSNFFSPVRMSFCRWDTDSLYVLISSVIPSSCYKPKITANDITEILLKVALNTIILTLQTKICLKKKSNQIGNNFFLIWKRGIYLLRK